MAVPTRRDICKHIENVLNDMIKSPANYTTFNCLEHVFYFQLQTWVYVMFGYDANFISDQYHYFLQRHYWQYHTLTAAVEDNYYLETEGTKLRLLADKLKLLKNDIYQAAVDDSNTTRHISREEVSIYCS